MVVATTACYYICAVYPNGAFHKVLHRFSWVNLLTLRVDEKNGVLIFVFQGTQTALHFDIWWEFISAIVSYLKIFMAKFPEFKYDQLPERVVLRELTDLPPQVVSLLLSEAYSQGRRLDEKGMMKFAKLQKRSKELRIDASQPFDASLVPLMGVLVHTTEIEALHFGGKTFEDLWGRLGAIIEGNRGITPVCVFDQRKREKFDVFIKQVKHSRELTGLGFRDVLFKDRMANSVGKLLKKRPGIHLSFTACQFAVTILPVLEMFAGCLETIRSLTLAEEPLLAGSPVPLLRALGNSWLESLSLRDAQLDINLFFTQLNEVSRALPGLTALDLSGNVIGMAYTGDWKLPARLATLALRRVTWEGKSLLAFLTKQAFPTSEMWVDLSMAGISEAQTFSLAQELPPEMASPPFVELLWEGNPLYVKLVLFFAKFKKLQTLSIANCAIPRSERKGIIGAIASLLASVPLVTFNAQRAFASLRGSWFPGLRGVLANHPTLKSLDIGFNSLGDEGVTVLQAIMTANPRITELGFDGLDVSSVHVLVDLLDTLTRLERVRKIIRPSKEIERLKGRSGGAPELRAAWLAASAMRVSEETPGEELLEPIQHQATWALQIGLGGQNPPRVWDNLRRRFSYEAITGVAVGGESSDC
jgi:hypothetical protein